MELRKEDGKQRGREKSRMGIFKGETQMEKIEETEKERESSPQKREYCMGKALIKTLRQFRWELKLKLSNFYSTC